MDAKELQRGFKSYGELTLKEVLDMGERISGEWDGDDSGRKEDRAHSADEMLVALNTVINNVMALEEEL